MALVNIPRSREDPNYRYKMPKLISKIEGRGNGIKTNIPNMGDLSRSLKRPPMYVTKFFGCELGTMVKYLETEKNALINGSHSESDLVKILDKFIETYVLCQNCQLPEMDMLLKKEQLFGKCNACGYTSQLDSTHKAATYMIRNPPNQETSTMGKKKSERKSSSNITTPTTTPSTQTSSGSTQLTKQKSDGEVKKTKSQTKKSGDKKIRKNSSATDVDDVNGDIKSDTPESKAKSKTHTKKASTMEFLNEELDYESPEIEDVIERLKSFIGQSNITDFDKFFHELRMLQVTQDFNSKCKIYIIFRVVFDNRISRDLISAQIPILKRAKDNSVKPDDILDAVQYFCHKYSPQTLSDYPYIMKTLYDEVILEADDIIDFYLPEKEDVIYTKCRTIIQPLLTWLETPEEDDEEEDETEGGNKQTCVNHKNKANNSAGHNNNTHTDVNNNTNHTDINTHNNNKNGTSTTNYTTTHSNTSDSDNNNTDSTTMNNNSQSNGNTSYTFSNGATLHKITHSESFSSLVSKDSESGERTEFHDAEDGSMSSGEDA